MPEVPVIPPQPVATNITVQEVKSTKDGSSWMVWTFTTPIGQAHYFFELENSIGAAQMILTASQKAKTGLIVPTDGDVQNVRKLRDNPQA